MATEQEMKIFKMMESGVKGTDIAKELGVTKSYIYSTRNKVRKELGLEKEKIKAKYPYRLGSCFISENQRRYIDQKTTEHGGNESAAMRAIIENSMKSTAK